MVTTRSLGTQSLSRIAAICKFLSVLCKIAFLAMIAWAVFVIFMMGFSIATTNFGGSVPILAIAVLVFYALYSANSCLLPFVLGRMLNDISENRTPFTLQNASRLLILAFILLLYAVLETALAAVGSQFSFFIQDNSIQIGALVRDFASNSGTTLNLFPLLMSAMFFALSYVFKYGVLLQQESDETL